MNSVTPLSSNPDGTKSRRGFLRATSLTAAGLVAGFPEASFAKEGDAIDAHVHVWTPDVKRYPLHRNYTVADMNPPSFTPEQLFTHTKPNGVQRIVLIQMSYYQFDNCYMLDVIKRFPGVFSGVAIVDEDADDVGDHMVDLASRGVRGFRIYPGKETLEDWLGSPGMAEMWRVGAEKGLAMCPLINPEALPAIGKMCERFPETRVVIDHFARIGMDGILHEEQLADLCHLAKFPNTYVKTSAFYALGKKSPPYTDLGPMIRRLRDTFGAERLMWASDCPFQVGPGHNYADSIALIRDGLDFLSPEDRDWILRGTAEKVFFG